MTLTFAVFSIKTAFTVGVRLLAVLEDASGDGLSAVLGEALGSAATLLATAVGLSGRVVAPGLGAGAGVAACAMALGVLGCATAGAAPTCRLRVLQIGVFIGLLIE